MVDVLVCSVASEPDLCFGHLGLEKSKVCRSKGILLLAEQPLLRVLQVDLPFKNVVI